MKTLNIEQMESYNGYGYWACMRGFFNSDSGTMVNTMVIIGGVINPGFTIAGAAIVGILAIGCIPATGTSFGE